MDVFLRIYLQNELRRALAYVVVRRLVLLADIRIFVVWCNGPEYLALDQKVHRVVMVYPQHSKFHVESKRLSEEYAESQVYCVIDDDQLPIGNDFFAQGEKALLENAEYGMLAGFPLEYGLHGQPYADRKEEVIEAHSIGCPYFVRKGTLSFPDGPLRQYDGILSKVVTDQGLKTGFARKCVYNHIGFGFSQVQHAD